MFLWGLCINAVGAGLGRGRGNRPLRALTAAAPGYSPYNYDISDIIYSKKCIGIWHAVFFLPIDQVAYYWA